MALNAKQDMFCREYLIDLNVTQAVIRAGYSVKTANRIAAKLLSKVDIQNRIAELKNKRNEDMGINADYVLRRLVEIDQLEVLDSGVTQVYQYFDVTDGGKTKEFWIGSGGLSKFSARSPAWRMLRRPPEAARSPAKKLRGMSTTMPATPEMVSLTAQCLITTSGFGTAEDRDWHISKLDFSLDAQGFTVKMELE